MEPNGGIFKLIPTLRWGRGIWIEIGREAAQFGQRAFIVISASAESILLNPILHQLSLQGITGHPMAMTGEPTLETLKSALSEAKTFNTQVVIGIGGGSAMDLAKALAGLYMHEGDINNAFYGRASLSPGIPLITVPTVPGSGAEVTPNAVITDRDHNLKQSIRHSEWVARTALIDPELSSGIPAERLLYSCLDGLCQAVEAFTSLGANEVTDIFARDAALRFATELPNILEHPENYQARESLAIASFQGGVALAAARLGAVHGLAHPLGVRYQIPHGKICAVLLPMVMRFNLPNAYPKYGILGRDLGLCEHGMDTYDQAVQFVKFIMNFNKHWGIPQHLRQLGVDKDDFETIIQESLPSGSLKANPREVRAADLMAILQENW